ncbi:hypothetical protein ACG2K1_05065 [Neisseria sp. 23W00296]
MRHKFRLSDGLNPFASLAGRLKSIRRTLTEHAIRPSESTKQAFRRPL